jgi:hypothetical protein
MILGPITGTHEKTTVHYGDKSHDNSHITETKDRTLVLFNRQMDVAMI